ncbi:hypothetical protein BC828DRAFT_385769 [Blastocladiella britannica]|nr:hypothetical protein BC828DRAFT_385769 [Blastocladiella britannica]
MAYPTSPWNLDDIQLSQLLAVQGVNLLLSSASCVICLVLLRRLPLVSRLTALSAGFTLWIADVAYFFCYAGAISPTLHDIIMGGMPFVSSTIIAMMTLHRFQILTHALSIHWISPRATIALIATTLLMLVAAITLYVLSYTLPLAPTDQYQPGWRFLVLAVPIAWDAIVDITLSTITFWLVYGIRRQLLMLMHRPSSSFTSSPPTVSKQPANGLVALEIKGFESKDAPAPSMHYSTAPGSQPSLSGDPCAAADTVSTGTSLPSLAHVTGNDRSDLRQFHRACAQVLALILLMLVSLLSGLIWFLFVKRLEDSALAGVPFRVYVICQVVQWQMLVRIMKQKKASSLTKRIKARSAAVAAAAPASIATSLKLLRRVV